MILKKKRKPWLLVKLEALERRCPASHFKRPALDDDLERRRAGYRGEQSLDYHLSFLDSTVFRILHDIRLLNHLKMYYF